MKKDQYIFPKSSFLGIAKDTSLITKKLLENKKLLKLIYYNSKDWESKPDLTAGQIKSLFTNKQISNVPKVIIDENKYTYLRITYDSFVPNETNPWYRDHLIEIKIICHFDDWDLGDYELRPYRIAGEIDSMLNGQHLTGIGLLQFLGADQALYDDEFGGIDLRYLAIHGEEDRINPLE